MTRTQTIRYMAGPVILMVTAAVAGYAGLTARPVVHTSGNFFRAVTATCTADPHPGSTWDAEYGCWWY